MKFGLEEMLLKLNLFSVGSDGCGRLGVAEKVLMMKIGLLSGNPSELKR